MKNRLFVTIRNVLLCLIILNVLFVCLMSAATAVPESAIHENIVESANIFVQEGNYVIPSNYNANCIKWDNWTTINTYLILLGEHDNWSFFSFVPNYTAGYEGETPVEIISGYLKNNGESRWAYERYWCGSLVLIRPLSLLFNVSEIRIFFLIFTMIMMVWTFILLNKRMGRRWAITFLLFFIISGMLFNSMCLTYFKETFVTLIALVVMFSFFHDENRCIKYEDIFLLP